MPPVTTKLKFAIFCMQIMVKVIHPGVIGKDIISLVCMQSFEVSSSYSSKIMVKVIVFCHRNT